MEKSNTEINRSQGEKRIDDTERDTRVNKELLAPPEVHPEHPSIQHSSPDSFDPQQGHSQEKPQGQGHCHVCLNHPCGANQKVTMQHIIDHVGVNLDAGKE